MNAERLLAYYEQVADAPNAIARLRRFMLELAVRGKLVPQNPADEPASELLKRIAAQKTRLAKAGEIRKPKPLPAVDRPPFDLPANWRWTRIREVTTDRGQEIPKKNFTYIDVTSIDKDFGVVANPKVMKANEAPSRARKTTQKGDVVYSCVRPYLLNVAVIETDFDPPPIASTAFAILNGHGLVVPRYVWIVLRSPFMVECVEANQRGQAYPAINDSDFAMLPFPLPPLAEQHRIVAKVDELMGLCDRLEATRADRETMRDRLAAASLDLLNSPKTALSAAAASPPEPSRAFADHARFVLDALPTLTARPDQIMALRGAILDLAIAGHLTNRWRQMNADVGEAMSVVEELENMHQKNGGHRRGNAAFATEGVHDLASQNLPSSWSLTDLRTAVRPDRPITYGILMPGPDIPGGVPYVRVADFPGNRLNLSRIKCTSREIEEKYARARLVFNDILLSIRGTVGRTCLVPEELNGANITQDTARLSLQESIDRNFVLIVLRAPSTQLRMQRCSKGAAVRGMNIGDVRAMQLPVPPLAEQHFIVAKVDALMGLCDELEASLTAAVDTRSRLLDALLAEALVPDEDRLREAAE